MTQGFVPGTRTLVNGTTLIATTLLALITGHQVGTKNQSIWEYEQYIGDEWADFLADVYDTCKRQWHYQIPQGMAEREHLRALCAQTLEFENHVLAVCREPVLADLQSLDDTSRLLALQRLQYVAYPGEDFMDALRVLEAVGSDEIRQRAQRRKTDASRSIARSG